MKLVASAVLLLLPLRVAAAPCPCATPLLAGFHHQAASGRYVTTTSVVVPAAFAEVAQVLEDFNSYPNWLFTGPDGKPTLHAVTLDPTTGAFTMGIGQGQEGLPLAGTLIRKRDAQSLSLHGSGTADDVKAWAFDLAALPDSTCEGRTRVELTIELTYGLKARLFGGSSKGIPSLLPLAVRDDIASRFLDTVERLSCIGLSGVTADAGGAPMFAFQKAAPARVLRCRPGSLVVGSKRSQAFGARIGKLTASGPPDLGDLLAVVHEGLEGTYPIAAWYLNLEGQTDPAWVGEAPGSIHVDVRIQPQGEGFSLGFGFGASE